MPQYLQLYRCFLSGITKGRAEEGLRTFSKLDIEEAIDKAKPLAKLWGKEPEEALRMILKGLVSDLHAAIVNPLTAPNCFPEEFRDKAKPIIEEMEIAAEKLDLKKIGELVEKLGTVQADTLDILSKRPITEARLAFTEKVGERRKWY